MGHCDPAAFAALCGGEQLARWLSPELRGFCAAWKLPPSLPP